jgi:membrane-associated phospholipid phosphatase
MEIVFDTGISFIIWFQSLGDWLILPMQFFSFLGSEYFFLIVAPALYWCYSASLGLRVGLFLMISGSINSALKIFIHGPRPSWVDTQVNVYSSESSFGTPSGHSQNAVIVWGTIADFIGGRLVWIVAIALIFLTGLSRMHLGLHFPHDVLLGWLIGALLLWVILRFDDPITSWLNTKGVGQQITIVFAASLVLIGIGLVARFSLGDWSIPPEWIENSYNALPEAEAIDPLSLKGFFTNAGAFFGLASGAIWLKNRGGFTTSGKWQQLLGRYIIGLIGVLVIWMGLDYIFPEGDTFIALTLRFVRYALVGIWISAIAPFIYLRFGLSTSTSLEN